MTKWARDISAVVWSAGIVLMTGSANAQLNAEVGASAEAEANTDDGAAVEADMDADAEPEPEAAPPPPEAEADADLAPPPPAAAPAAVAGISDHESVVGHLAIGYLGRRGMLMPGDGVGIGGLAPGNSVERQAPIIGIRYWLDPMIGIDAGFGLLLTSGSVEPDAGDAVDLPGATVFMLHAGLPLSLISSGHFSFQVVPELNFGMGSQKIAGVDPLPDTDQSALHIDVGARAGAEIQFGFIDIPQLSLQGGIGLSFAMDKLKVEEDGAEDSLSMTTLTTGVGGNPWNIFTSNISALYYF